MKNGVLCTRKNSSKLMLTTAVLSITMLLVMGSLASAPKAQASHQYRSEVETHGGSDNTGGLRSTIKIQSPSVSSCAPAARPCTHTMVYAFQLGKGFIGAGWNKYKNAAGTVMLWGLVHYGDYAYAQAFYTITEDLSGKVGTSQLFEVSKTTYDSTGSCWRGWAYSVAETVCFNDFKWGHPRVSGRLNDNVVTFGTSIGTMTNIKNRALTSATWVNMGSSLISKLCADSTYTDIHAHSDINGFYTFHLSPPTATGETYNLSCDGTTTDLGG